MRNLFTAAEAEQAFHTWGCNCGPTALAAIAGITLDRARSLIRGFDRKCYTSPAMMLDALQACGRKWHALGPHWPEFGLVRIQWDGPWMAAGVPIPARYKFTHWIATKNTEFGRGIFDVNALGNGSGWCSYADWQAIIVPAITQTVRRASGAWSITHGHEIARPAAPRPGIISPNEARAMAGIAPVAH